MRSLSSALSGADWNDISFCRLVKTNNYFLYQKEIQIVIAVPGGRQTPAHKDNCILIPNPPQNEEGWEHMHLADKLMVVDKLILPDFKHTKSKIPQDGIHLLKCRYLVPFQVS